MRTVLKKALGARCAVLGVAALLAAGVQAELPDTHRLVKYVESDGTQYIDTGVTATKDARLVMKFSYTVADEGGGGVGYAANGSAQSFRFWRSKEENTGNAIYNVNIDDQYGDVDTYNSGAALDTDVHVIDISNASKSIDGHVFVNTKGSLSKTLAGSLYLFGQNWGWNPKYGSPMKGRIYSCQIYDGSPQSLVRDFVPCIRKSDGVAMLYDLVGEKEYPIKVISGLTSNPLVPANGTGLSVSHTYPELDIKEGFDPAFGDADVSGTFTCTAPATEQTLSGGDIKYTVVGWKLTVTDALGQQTVTSGTETSCEVSVGAEELAELEWQLATQFKVTATTGDDWTVSPVTQWVAGGGSAEVTVTPPTGKGLLRWEDGDGAELGRDKTLVLANVSGPLTVTPVFCNLIHVETTGNDATGDGSEARPYATLTNGLAHAHAGDMVLLGEGTFEVDRQVELTSAITVKGAGRDLTTVKQTAKSGDARRVFHLNHESAVVQGVTITGGKTNNLGTQDAYGKHSGAGVLIDTNGGRVLDCRITENAPGMNDYGAVHLVSSKGLVARTIIDNNKNGNGYPYSGVGLTMTAGRVESCLIANNYANGSSRGESPEAGGVCISGGTLQNCTIVGNTGWNVGGLHVSGTSAKVINCIVFGNKLSGSKKALAGAPDYYCSSSSMDLSTCLLSTDPTFKNAVSNDYHISCAGAAADKGTGEETFSSGTDLEGNARVVNGKCDLGCYESLGFDDWIDITAVPEEYGTVSPAYGQTDGLAADGKLPVSAPSSIQIGTDMATCIGWKLYDAEGTQVGEGEDCAFTYEHQGVCRKLVWQWKPSFGVTVSAAEGGTVQASAAAAGYGEVVTITATPDPSLAGASFWKWEGDVPAENVYDNPLELTVNAAKSVRAIFGTTHAYVASAESPSATPAFPYGSPATAANTLKDAFAVTVDNGVIECGEGTFAPGDSFTVDRPVTIRGAGYDKATLNLNGKRITLSHKECSASGFKVTGIRIGNNANGGGFTVSAGTLADCRFIGNKASAINAKGLCAAATGANGRITRCVFDGNDSSANNIIGIVAVADGLVDNCLIVSNKCQQGGGVYLKKGTLRNCTIADNTATTGSGGGVYVPENSIPTMMNCIVYGNTAKTSGDEISVSGNNAKFSASSYNNCLGEGVQAGVDPVDGKPSLSADYRLNPGSVGINQGHEYTGMADETDLGGDPRVVGDIVDLGCYEYVPSTAFICTISANAWSALVGGSIQLSADFDEEAFDPADYTFTWTVKGDDASEATVESVQKPSVTLPNPTEYTIALAVTDKDGQAVFACTADRKVKVLPATVYLAEENDGCEFPYDTEATAATNLAELVSILVDDVTVVALPGTHRVDAMVLIDKAITIRGKEGWRETTVRQTRVAQADLGLQCVFELNNAKATLQGLTICNGFSTGTFDASGVSLYAGKVVDCRVTGNGAGMNGGAAVELHGSNARLERSVVDNNSNGNAYGACPGVEVSGGVVESCLIYSNVVKDCSSRTYAVAGGVSMGGGTLRNCTVTANHGRGVGGVKCSSGQMVNCIVFGNTATADYWVDGTSPEYKTDSPSRIVSCRFADPLFKNAAELDFHLTKSSPAINAGVNGSYTADDTDLDGKLRIHNFGKKSGIADIGCYETPWGTPGMLLLVK